MTERAAATIEKAVNVIKFTEDKKGDDTKGDDKKDSKEEENAVPQHFLSTRSEPAFCVRCVRSRVRAPHV
ncbi:hypothetical protein PG985_016024 [Apiospora marii]|uniref:Uncharacterized protein n=1 Tax=Apiospora marii TaxID=335849 RepID=A0ABR1S550_9PEZI